MKAEITCPACSGKTEVQTPKNGCLPFAKCSKCGKLIAAKPPSCCVVCSYSQGKCEASAVKGLRVEKKKGLTRVNDDNVCEACE